MYILGISAFYHDSAAALIADGEIIAAAEEERFTRLKNDHSFPVNAIKFCLNFTAITIDDLEAVVFYEKPFIKFERILETYYQTAPRGLMSFLKAMPVWLKEKLFLKKKIKDYLKDVEVYDQSKLRILFSDHHLSHAASAFFPSSFQQAAILTIDGVGEWATCTISRGSGNTIKRLKQLNFPYSVGLLYSAFTYYCGFKVNQDEYKLMGLAAYGDKDSEEYKRIRDIIERKLIEISPDGSIRLEMKYFSYTTSLQMVNDRVWKALFGIRKRKESDEFSPSYCNMALAIQHVTEKVMVLMAQEAKRVTGFENLCLAGGVALNCVANGKILQEGVFGKLFIQPASNDAGGALGAALAAYYIHYKKKRLQTFLNGEDAMKGSLLGPSYSDETILKASKKFNLKLNKIEGPDFFKHVSYLLQEGKVIGWYQGRLEFGPRALGNRSILADPRVGNMQEIINKKIKYREGFRPFAPVIIEEEVTKYFDISTGSPYMLLVAKLKEKNEKML